MDRENHVVQLIRAEIAMRIATDLALGRPADLAAYQAAFPAHRHIVAEEYARMTSADPAPDTAPGTPVLPRRFGRYELVEVLGHGGQGVVYLAHDPNLDLDVALKVLHLPNQLSPSALSRFRREGQVLAKIDHPAICSVLASGVEAGCPYLVMRLFEGVPLRSLIDDWRDRQPSTELTESRRQTELALRVLASIAAGLHVVHGRGVAHRDVTPSNILVNGDRACLVDFGLAADDECPPLTAEGDRLGTRNYAAPEQVSGRVAEIGARSDIFSLGMVLYEATTLFRAGRIEGNVPRGLVRRGMVRTRARELAAVIEKATAPRPQDRYRGIHDLGDDLRALVDGRDVSVKPAWPGLRLARWSRQHPVVAGLGLGLVASLALGLAFALVLLDGKVVAEKQARAAHDESEQRGYQLSLAAALDSIELGRPAEAARYLGACRPADRGVEWRYLTTRSAAQLVRVTPGLGPLAGLVAAEHGPICVAADGAAAQLTPGGPPTDVAPGLADGRLIAFDATARGWYRVSTTQQHLVVERFEVGMSHTSRWPLRDLGSDSKVVAATLLPDDHWLLATAKGHVVVATDAGPDHGYDLGTVFVPARIARSDDARLVALLADPFLMGGEVVLFDVSTGFHSKIVDRQFEMHVATLSRDGRKLVTAGLRTNGGASARLAIWDTGTSGLIVDRELPGSRPTSLCLEDHTDRVWLGSANGALRCFDGGLGAQACVQWGHEGSIDGILCDQAASLVTSVGADGSVRTWNARTGGGTFGVPVKPTWATSLVMDEQGVIWIGAEDHELLAYDLASGVPSQRDRAGEHPWLGLQGGRRVTWFNRTDWLRYDRDDGTLATFGNRAALTGTVAGFPSRDGERLYTVPDQANAIRVLPWNADGGALCLPGPCGGVFAIVDDANGSVVAAAAIHTILAWRGQQLVLHRTDLTVSCVALAADGRELAIGTKAGEVVLVDLETGAEQCVSIGCKVHALAFHPREARLAAAALDQTVRILDTRTATQLLTLRDASGTATAIAWSPSGDQLLARCAGGELRVWQAAESAPQRLETISPRAQPELAGSPGRLLQQLLATGAREVRGQVTLSSLADHPWGGPQWHATTLAMADAVLGVAPDDSLAFSCRATALFRLRRYGEARAELLGLRAPIAGAPGFVRAMATRAMARHALGDSGAPDDLRLAAAAAGNEGAHALAEARIFLTAADPRTLADAIDTLPGPDGRLSAGAEAGRLVDESIERRLAELASACPWDRELTRSLAWLFAVLPQPDPASQTAQTWLQAIEDGRHARDLVVTAILLRSGKTEAALQTLRDAEAEYLASDGIVELAFRALAERQAGSAAAALFACNRFRTLALRRENQSDPTIRLLLAELDRTFGR